MHDKQTALKIMVHHDVKYFEKISYIEMHVFPKLWKLFILNLHTQSITDQIKNIT